jgi:hypothetical protein
MVDTADQNESVQGNDALPFSVEITGRDSGPRVLARAANASLARAIFSSALIEYPNQRILLKRGEQTISDSAGLSTPA